ncbi:MAG TPA: sulfatase-like hydrolase/transferase, partial [Sphingobacterium sp.]|nr:sulfatase-like hydrolase/transferase [Sphingobacterium sp.]
MKYIVPLQKTALLIFFMLLFGFAKSQTDTKPNIIWIMTEDMSPELGCYGYPHVQTPHLDKLSKEGKLYTHMFATSPVCSPTRSAMITGMYQTTIGAHNHRSHRKDDYKLPDPVQPITEYLRQAG